MYLAGNYELYSTGTINYSRLQTITLYIVLSFRKYTYTNYCSSDALSSINIHSNRTRMEERSSRVFLALFENSRSRSFLGQCAVLFAAWGRR